MLDRRRDHRRLRHLPRRGRSARSQREVVVKHNFGIAQALSWIFIWGPIVYWLVLWFINDSVLRK